MTAGEQESDQNKRRYARKDIVRVPIAFASLGFA